MSTRKDRIMNNIPDVKLGIIATSRSCFPSSLSIERRKNIVSSYPGEIVELQTLIIREEDVVKALAEIKEKGVNSLVVYLGNFGPETPETLLAQNFDGPCMFVAAAEEGNLIDHRGDAYCGLLNASYNLDLRKRKVYIPKNPVGDKDELCLEISRFVPIARALLGLGDLKVISFGPRPTDFLACNAPIKGLYDLGVEIEENSELDLLVSYHKHQDDPRIPDKIEEMKKELGDKNPYSGILPRLAQYELTLLDYASEHRGMKKYVCFANKCWPAFQTEFGFVPCYVNSRMTGMNYPVSCEVDIYGALSEYIGLCLSLSTPTLLDINNTVPKEMYERKIQGKYDYRLHETFMGFHCGNTSSCLLSNPHMGYQRIMKRDLEPERKQPDITRGTMEGNIRPGDCTIFRLQGTKDGSLKAYCAQGEFLDMDCESFGSIGAIGIKEMERFYRYVLIEKHFPHHAAVMFGHYGRAFFDLMDYLGIRADFNHGKENLYPEENPF